MVVSGAVVSAGEGAGGFELPPPPPPPQAVRAAMPPRARTRNIEIDGIILSHQSWLAIHASASIVALMTRGRKASHEDIQAGGRCGSAGVNSGARPFGNVQFELDLELDARLRKRSVVYLG